MSDEKIEQPERFSTTITNTLDLNLTERTEGTEDFLETTPVIGQAAATVGLDQWRDNYGNTLSADNLHCADEQNPRDLTFGEAANLYASIAAARTSAVENSSGADQVRALFLTEGKQTLGRLESPLQTICKPERGAIER